MQVHRAGAAAPPSSRPLPIGCQDDLGLFVACRNHGSRRNGMLDPWLSIGSRTPDGPRLSATTQTTSHAVEQHERMPRSAGIWWYKVESFANALKIPLDRSKGGAGVSWRIPPHQPIKSLVRLTHPNGVPRFSRHSPTLRYGKSSPCRAITDGAPYVGCCTCQTRREVGVQGIC
ncbi:hypothetical protein LZ30DRAFT_157024 [Colletotrichum cereale]|nr:hypothetical protein LZ30DRAFT_157024 [Colletotrichum cereale]